MATTKKQNELIKRTFNALEYELSCIDWNNYGKQLLELCMSESKGHDRFRGEGLKRGISILNEARYFALKRVQECLDGYAPKPEDYLMLQKSVFAAYAIATNARFKDAMQKFLNKHKGNLREIACLDYSDLIKDDGDKRRGFKSSPVGVEA